MGRLTLAAVVLFVASCGAQVFDALTVRFQDITFSNAGASSTVGRQVFLEQLGAAPAGGPQALEGYVKIAHDRGVVALAIGAIGNVEQNGAGDVTEIRSTQSGGVVTGPGRVHHWTGHYFAQPRRAANYTGAVNLDVVDYATFDNGWAIRPSGDRLLICDPRGECRDVFALGGSR